MGDCTRIQQIIRNLISNALKFTEKGGVRIEVETDEDHQMLVHVRDSGIGIPKNKLDTIFEKFTQADASTTRKYGGTGLGLAISRELALLMRGTITVTSEAGKGSCFTLRIPMEVPSGEVCFVTEAPVRTHTETREARFRTDARILAVDDHPINLMFLLKLLKKLGITQVDTAENGQEALDKITLQAYDLVLMDCQMPEMDGYTATHTVRLQEQDGTSHVPIIAMTANAMIGDRETCLNAGMDDYITKPVKPETLIGVLNQWIPATQNAQALAQELPPASPSTAPVDMEHLRLFTDGDREAEAEIFELFLSEADINIQSLRQALQTGDQAAWKAAAHKFKGASANLGAFALSEQCKQAEIAWEAADHHKAELLDRVCDAMAAVSGYIASQMEGQ
jgi:two-component system sensor histidine kinase/response regulator